MKERHEGYRPPQDREGLERRYAAGERKSPDTELSYADLSRLNLDGADFERHSWFSHADFSGSSLRSTSVRECILKCADIEIADLTAVSLGHAAIESINLKDATLLGVKVAGATSYGYMLKEVDELPM